MLSSGDLMKKRQNLFRSALIEHIDIFTLAFVQLLAVRFWNAAAVIPDTRNKTGWLMDRYIDCAFPWIPERYDDL